MHNDIISYFDLNIIKHFNHDKLHHSCLLSSAQK